jgi:hypothetical protein
MAKYARYKNKMRVLGPRYFVIYISSLVHVTPYNISYVVLPPNQTRKEQRAVNMKSQPMILRYTERVGIVAWL